MRDLIKGRAGAAVVAAAILLAVFSGGAAAAYAITSADIVDETIQKRDVGPSAVGTSEVANGSLGLVDLSADAKSKLTEGVTYVDHVLTATSEEFTFKPAPCPTGTQVVTGFILSGGTNASYNLGTDYVDPAQNAWMVNMGTSNPGEGTLPVRVVCLG